MFMIYLKNIGNYSIKKIIKKMLILKKMIKVNYFTHKKKVKKA
jgi:hypothetical protein